MSDAPFSLICDQQTLNIIMAALGEMPAKVAMPVIQSIQMQVNAHIHAQQERPGAPAQQKTLAEAVAPPKAPAASLPKKRSGRR